MLSSSERGLIETFITALLHGIYIATSIHCLRWLLFADDGWKLRKKINRLMTITTLLVFLLTTFNNGMTPEIDFQVIHHRVTGPIEDTLLTLSGSIAMLLVDVILVYRCWVVYEKSWRIVSFPILFWFGSITSVILGVYYQQEYLFHITTNRKSRVLGLKMLTAFYGFIIATNIYATGAIIYRIWHVAKSSGNTSKRLSNIVRILAESGMLLTSSSVFALLTTLLSLNTTNGIIIILHTVIDALNPSVAGMTFNLILIHVHKSRLDSSQSLADSRNTNDQVTLSFRAAEVTTPSQVQISDFPNHGSLNESVQMETNLSEVHEN